MGQRGPIPKRSDQRVRRNQDEGPIEQVTAIGVVEVPELDIFDPHPMISDFYESLKESAQSRYYEASDWQFARVTMHFLDGLLKSSRPSGQMLATVSSMLTELLVSEGARRRVRLEIEREQAQATIATVSQLYADRLAQ